MAHTPSITPLPLEQLRTSQVKHLPPIPPSHHTLLAIRLLQSLLDDFLITQHRQQPILTRLPVMHAVNPPLPLHPQLLLEEQQKIGGRHRSASEKVLGHPPTIKVVRRGFVRENVHKQLSARLQRSAHFGGQKGIVLHVLKQLNRDDAIKGAGLEFVVDDIASNNGEILEPL